MRQLDSHRHNRHEFEQTPGDSVKQRSLACCDSWGHKESEMTYQLNNKCVLCISFIYFACVESSLRHMGLVASLHVGS